MQITDRNGVTSIYRRRSEPVAWKPYPFNSNLMVSEDGRVRYVGRKCAWLDRGETLPVHVDFRHSPSFTEGTLGNPLGMSPSDLGWLLEFDRKAARALTVDQQRAHPGAVPAECVEVDRLGGGWPIVWACYKGQAWRWIQLDRIVGATWVPGWAGHNLRHLDGDPFNCRAENLVLGELPRNAKINRRNYRQVA